MSKSAVQVLTDIANLIKNKANRAIEARKNAKIAIRFAKQEVKDATDTQSSLAAQSRLRAAERAYRVAQDTLVSWRRVATQFVEGSHLRFAPEIVGIMSYTLNHLDSEEEIPSFDHYRDFKGPVEFTVQRRGEFDVAMKKSRDVAMQATPQDSDYRRLLRLIDEYRMAATDDELRAQARSENKNDVDLNGTRRLKPNLVQDYQGAVKQLRLIARKNPNDKDKKNDDLINTVRPGNVRLASLSLDQNDPPVELKDQDQQQSPRSSRDQRPANHSDQPLRGVHTVPMRHRAFRGNAVKRTDGPGLFPKQKPGVAKRPQPKPVSNRLSLDENPSLFDDQKRNQDNRFRNNVNNGIPSNRDHAGRNQARKAGGVKKSVGRVPNPSRLDPTKLRNAGLSDQQIRELLGRLRTQADRNDALNDLVHDYDQRNNALHQSNNALHQKNNKLNKDLVAARKALLRKRAAANANAHDFNAQPVVNNDYIPEPVSILPEYPQVDATPMLPVNVDNNAALRAALQHPLDDVSTVDDDQFNVDDQGNGVDQDNGTDQGNGADQSNGVDQDNIAVQANHADQSNGADPVNGAEPSDELPYMRPVIIRHTTPSNSQNNVRDLQNNSSQNDSNQAATDWAQRLHDQYQAHLDRINQLKEAEKTEAVKLALLQAEQARVRDNANLQREIDELRRQLPSKGTVISSTDSKLSGDKSKNGTTTELEDALVQARTENKQLVAAIQEMKEDKARLEDENQKQKTANDRMNAGLEDLRSQVATLKKDAQAKFDERDAKGSADKKELESRIEKMKQEHDLQIQKMRMEHELQIQRMKLEHEAQMQKMKLDHDARIQHLKAENDEAARIADGKLKAAIQEQERLAQELRKANNERGLADDTAKRLAQELQRERDDHEKTRQTLVGSREETEAVRTDLTAALNKAISERDTAVHEREQLRLALERAESSLEKADTKIRELEAHRPAERKGHLDRRDDSHRVDSLGLDDKTSHDDAHRDRTDSAELARLKREKAELKQQLDDVNETLEEVKSERDAFEEQVNANAENVEQLEEAFRKDLKEMEADRDAEVIAREEADARREDAETRFAESEARIAASRADADSLADYRADVSDARNLIVTLQDQLRSRTSRLTGQPYGQVSVPTLRFRTDKR